MSDFMFYFYNEVFSENGLESNIYNKWAGLIPSNYKILHQDQLETLNGIDYTSIFLIGFLMSVLTLTCCASNYATKEPRYIVVNGEPVNGEIVSVSNDRGPIGP